MVGVGVFDFQGLCDSFLTVHMHDRSVSRSGVKNDMAPRPLPKCSPYGSVSSSMFVEWS